MKKLTLSQMRELLRHARAGIGRVPCTDISVLNTAMEKLEDGLRWASLHQAKRSKRTQREENRSEAVSRPE